MNRIKQAMTALFLGLLFGAFIVWGFTPDEPMQVDVSNASYEEVDALRDAGYWSTQGDKCDCMYHPSMEPEWSKGV